MGEVIASLEGVTHRYGDVRALDGIDLEVRKGEVLAVLGPNGAGKTTAISILLGTLAVQAGQATVFAAAPGSQSARIRRGAMLQSSGVPEVLTVGEHLTLFRSYYPRAVPVDRLLKMAGIEDLADRRFARLSGGQKQRVMFALALCGDPELVFLDEPTTGLDLDARRRLWDEIRALREAGRTTVLTTHYLEEADALADRVIVIHQGRAIAEGTPAQIKARTAGRRIRCITSTPIEKIRALPGVVRVESSGQHVDVLATDAEGVVRALLSLDAALSDLSVTGAGLEEAFLALTRSDAEKEAA